MEHVLCGKLGKYFVLQRLWVVCVLSVVIIQETWTKWNFIDEQHGDIEMDDHESKRGTWWEKLKYEQYWASSNPVCYLVIVSEFLIGYIRPGSETKAFIVHCTASSMSIISYRTPLPESPGCKTLGFMWSYACSGTENPVEDPWAKGAWVLYTEE